MGMGEEKSAGSRVDYSCEKWGRLFPREVPREDRRRPWQVCISPRPKRSWEALPGSTHKSSTAPGRCSAGDGLPARPLTSRGLAPTLEPSPLWLAAWLERMPSANNPRQSRAPTQCQVDCAFLSLSRSSDSRHCGFHQPAGQKTHLSLYYLRIILSQ